MDLDAAGASAQKPPHAETTPAGGMQGGQWFAVIHVIATLPGGCASPVVVTPTHLSTGNGQVMR